MYVWIITSYLWMDLSRAFLQEPFLEATNGTLPLYLEYHFPKATLPHPRYSSTNRCWNLDCFYSTPTGCFHTLALFLKTIKLEHWQVVIIKPYDQLNVYSFFTSILMTNLSQNIRRMLYFYSLRIQSPKHLGLIWLFYIQDLYYR